jgi:hypothetical protein
MGSLGLRGGEAGALRDPDVQTVALSGIGRLRLADTVYVTQDGAKTIGLLFARDRSARTCLLALDLRPTLGPSAWLATVEPVARAGVRSNEGIGASFLRSPRRRTGE